MHNWFEKIDGFIKISDKVRYLVLFGPESYDAIYNGVRYVISEEKSGITDIINHNFVRIRINSYNSLPTEKSLTFHNVINIFLEKGSNEDKYNTYKCYIMIELTLLKELMLIRQVNQKSAIFVTIGILKIKILNLNKMSAIDARIY